MTVNKTYTFTDSSNYDFDNDEIEVLGGVAKKKKIVYPDELIYADFRESLDLHRYNATKVPYDIIGATISGGKLDLTGGTIQKMVSYNADNLDDLNNTGCIRF